MLGEQVDTRFKKSYTQTYTANVKNTAFLFTKIYVHLTGWKRMKRATIF